MPKPAQPGRHDVDIVPDWDFRSFPVYFGFASGAFVAAFLILFLPFDLILTLTIFGLSFGMAHLSTYWWRRRQIARIRERREEDERERQALAAREATRSGEAPAAEAPRRRRRRRRAPRGE